VDHLNRQKLYQFLMGLNESFGQARSQILLMNPIPTVNHAYAMVVNDECQKMASSRSSIGLSSMGSTGMDPLAMYSRTGGGSSSQGVNKFKRNFQVVCDFCRCKGHTKDQCYKLIGYPSDFKSKRKVNTSTGTGAYMVGNDVNSTRNDYEDVSGRVSFNYGGNTNVPVKNHMSNIEECSNQLQGCNFTKDQYSQILQMLKQSQGGGQNSEDSSHAHETQANTTGKVLLVSENSQVWIVDTGASNHMVSNLDMLTSDSVIKVKEPKPVYLPTGEVSYVSHTGLCKISPRSVITNVYHIPEFKYNLLSVSKVTKELNCSVTFFPHFCVFQELYTGKVREVGKEEDGLYLLLRNLSKEQLKHQSFVVPEKKLEIQQLSEKELNVWHKRLGHGSAQMLSKVFPVNSDVVKKVLNECTVCPCAKQTRNMFPVSSIKSSQIFYLLHLDVWGPYKQATFDGNRFFLTVVDDFSRMSWLFLLKSKADVCVALDYFLKFVKTQFDKVVRKVRSDNGTEFMNVVCATLFKERRIIHQRSCPYTPQQNRVAERKHRHLLEVTRALRFQGHIPIRFWGQCVLAAAYLINRIPSRVLGGKSPYERMYGVKPMISHLRILGCLCYAKVLTETDKLASRTKAAVHMGYSETQKGYILLDLTSNSFFVSRDVIFRESIFPFLTVLDKNDKGPFVNHLNNDMLNVEWRLGYDNMINKNKVNHKCVQETQRDKELNRDLTDNIEQNTVEEIVQGQDCVSNDPPTVVNRRSTRGVHPPVWMKDFVSLNMGKQVKYPIEECVSYSHLSKSYQEFVAATSMLTEPTSFADASRDPKWIEAMQDEIQALQDNNTWKLVELPKGKVAIGCRWIYKIKYKSTGEVERYKARLVAKGYSQKEGIDYKETFSLVVKMVTVRTILALAVSKSWHIHQMDVYNAFLNGDLEDEIYMSLPQGFSNQGENMNKVCRLEKSLYGLKQAPRQWNHKFAESL